MAEKETKSCSDCIHYDVCYKIEHYGKNPETTATLCNTYIDKNDVAPVVRCKDCIHSRINPFLNNSDIMTCQFWQYRSHQGTRIVMKNDDFCSYGERKEDKNG